MSNGLRGKGKRGEGRETRDLEKGRRGWLRSSSALGGIGDRGRQERDEREGREDKT
jgi:hypothetical protein